MASAISKAQSLAVRTVHIKVSPTPQNFTERRVVLQELEQKFGEVAMFRSLKYHPTAPVQNGVTVIFQTENAAKASLNTANHRYGLLIEPSRPASSFIGPNLPFPESDETPEEREKLQKSKEVKEFQLEIWPSEFIHEKYIKSPSTNPLYGPFKPISPKDSFIGGTLEQSIPPSLWATGLLDWETDEVKRKIGFAGLESELDGTGISTVDEKTAAYAMTGYLRRRMRKQMREAPKVMLGLKALWEERLQREEEEKQKVEREKTQKTSEPAALLDSAG